MRQPLLQNLDYPIVRSVVSGHRCYGPERVFFEAWAKENERKPGLNGGHGALELIMSDDPNRYPADISQRDMDVATEVVQWLGTNCGLSMIRTCEAEISRREKLERCRGNFAFQLHGSPFEQFAMMPQIEQLAELLANKWARSDSSRAYLKREILDLVYYGCGCYGLM
jgi:hypothetical protein